MGHFTLIIIRKLSKIWDSFDSSNWIYQNYSRLSIITIILFQCPAKIHHMILRNNSYLSGFELRR